ncbi:MAG TPA: TIGR01458 family HAD-type hydrolase [Chromatiaceae bacterium]|nr:TIGR01458 family HAD-type hydrolase [Chromatiaceae bacterium]
MKAILFDLDGVIYEGDRPVDGATEALAWCREKRIPHLFLTNTTSRPREALVEKLAAMRIPVEKSRLFTPAVAAREWLGRHIDGPVALFVPEAVKMEFADQWLLSDQAGEGAAAVVLGDLGEQWNFARLNRAFRLLMAEPPPVLLALGMTRYWRAPDGLRLDVGAFVAALRFATGIEPVVLGKPALSFFTAALDRLGTEASETVMIGDDIRGDIEAAQAAGIHAVLVRTGKFRDADLRLGIQPDAVLDSVAALPAWCGGD